MPGVYLRSMHIGCIPLYIGGIPPRFLGIQPYLYGHCGSVGVEV